MDNKKTKKIIIISGSIILVAGIGFMIYRSHKKKVEAQKAKEEEDAQALEDLTDNNGKSMDSVNSQSKSITKIPKKKISLLEKSYNRPTTRNVTQKSKEYLVNRVVTVNSLGKTTYGVMLKTPLTSTVKVGDKIKLNVINVMAGGKSEKTGVVTKIVSSTRIDVSANLQPTEVRYIKSINI